MALVRCGRPRLRTPKLKLKKLTLSPGGARPAGQAFAVVVCEEVPAPTLAARSCHPV